MDNYHIYERIGRGVHSEVFKGRKKQSIDYYAIKSIQLSQKRRVHQEVKTIHGLDHPNILKFYNWYETHNHLWLILEYCVGGDLKSLLQQDLCLPVESIHDFGRDLIAATQHLHSKGIIHCDLKPTNVLLDENGAIRLGGFGCARRLPDVSARSLFELPPASRGTPAYMAPELFQEGAAHSTASDLWAIGCIFYECFTGKPPFQHESFHDLVKHILNVEPAPLHCKDIHFEDLVMRLLDKNPATRISWVQMLTHPFWRFSLCPVQMPDEPALARYIERHNLASCVSSNGARGWILEDSKAADRAKRVRASVDVARLSQILAGDCALEQTRSDNLHPATLQIDSGHADLKSQAGNEAVERTATGTEQQCTGQNLCLTKPDPKPMNVPTGLDVMSKGKTTGEAYQASDSNMRLYSLVFHRMDLIVRPLVGNRCVESWNDAEWTLEHLPLGVAQWNRDRTIQAQEYNVAEFSSFIQTLECCLLSESVSSAIKSNLLAFLQSLTADRRTAEAMVNSNLTSALIQLMEHEVAAVRVRTTTVLGILIRYASLIDVHRLLPAIEKLQTQMRDDNTRIRRRAIATFGELLFYMSSSASAGIGQSGCIGQQIAKDTVGSVVRLLQAEEDGITLQYACMAIENMLTRKGPLPQCFAVPAICQALMKVLGTSKEDSVLTAACSAFGRVLLFSTALVDTIAMQGLTLLQNVLEVPASRMQVHALNAINVILIHSSRKERSAAMLMIYERLLCRAINLLAQDRECTRLAPKAVLTCALLLQLGAGWICRAVDADLLLLADRLASKSSDASTGSVGSSDKELAEYSAQCVGVLLQSVIQGTPQVLEEVHCTLSSRSDESSARLISCLVSVTKCQFTRLHVVSSKFLADIARFVRVLWGNNSSNSICTPEMPRASQQLQFLMEALLQPSDILLEHGSSFVSILMPALCMVAQQLVPAGIGNKGLQWDAAISTVGFLTESLMFYISSHEMYHSSGTAADRTCFTLDVTDSLDELLHSKVVSLLEVMILCGQDPMPLYAQKILAALLPRNPVYIRMMKDAVVHRFLSFLSIDSPNNNIHNIRVCCILVSNSVVLSKTLHELWIPSKVATVLTYAHENHVEAFLEPTVELCLALLRRELCEVFEGDPQRRIDNSSRFLRKMNSSLAKTVLPQITFCTQDGAAISFLAADCLLLLTQMYANECRAEVLSSEGLTLVMEALCGAASTYPVVRTPVRILVALLESLFHCGSSGKATATADVISRLHSVVGHFTNHENRNVKAWAVKVSEMFE